MPPETPAVVPPVVPPAAGAQPPVVPPAGAGSTGISAEAHAVILAENARIKAELDTIKGKGQNAELERIQAEHATALENATKAATETEKRAQKLEAAARKQAGLNALKGLKSEEYLSLVMDKVALDDSGSLTEDSKKALGEWQTAHAELFTTEGNPAPNTPGAGGSGRGTQGAWTPEDNALFALSSIDPAAVEKHANFGTVQFLRSISGGKA